MGKLRREFDDELDEINRIDGNSLELRNTLYLDYISRALITIADKMTEWDDILPTGMGYENFKALKEDVINEIPITSVGDIDAIFDKYEEAIYD